MLHEVADGDIAMEIRNILAHELIDGEQAFVGQQQRSSTCAKGFAKRGEVEDGVGSHSFYFGPNGTIAIGLEEGDLAIFYHAEDGSRHDGIGDSCMNSAIGFVDTIGGLGESDLACQKGCEKKFGFHAV